jgi:hypothetical protein
MLIQNHSLIRYVLTFFGNADLLFFGVFYYNYYFMGGMLVGVGVGEWVGGWKVDKISIGKEMKNDKMLGFGVRIKYLGYLIL